MMKIYVLGEKEPNANTFFDNIVALSSFEFLYCDYKQISPNEGDLILVQWPERIYNWKTPNNEELDDLERRLILFKKNCTIVYQLHNSERHFGMTQIFKRLYCLVENSADYFVHFGKYSLDKYSKKFPEKQHELIEHPLYLRQFDFLTKNEAREKLSLPNDSKIMMVPGRIRNDSERELVFKGFKHLKSKRKKLLVPYMKYKSSTIDFPGRTFLKRLVDIRKIHENYLNRKYSSKYHFGYRFISLENLILMIIAADFIFIPRIKNLNSGNIFLALTYHKIVVGPKIGNLTEVLKLFDFPIYEPNDCNSLKEAMVKITDLNFSEKKFNHAKLDVFTPDRIAFKWNDFLSKIQNEI